MGLLALPPDPEVEVLLLAHVVLDIRLSRTQHRQQGHKRQGVAIAAWPARPKRGALAYPGKKRKHLGIVALSRGLGVGELLVRQLGLVCLSDEARL